MPMTQRFLIVYSGVLTLSLALIVFAGFRSSKKTSFDEIVVHRINVVEPDGTLRLVISNKASFPGSPFKGKEIPRPDRKTTGMLFMDDEGSEIGGLTWGGLKKDGKTHSYGHLSFDRYNGDQVFVIEGTEKNGKTKSFININDSYSDGRANEEADRIRSLPADQQPAAWEKFGKDFPLTSRVCLGRGDDKSAALIIRDTEGHERIILKVGPSGDPSIELLDPSGKVISQLPPSQP